MLNLARFRSLISPFRLDAGVSLTAASFAKDFRIFPAGIAYYDGVH